MSVQVIQGDCLSVLKTLPAESVNCCVTSPPYWGLRDYGVEGQLGLERTPEEYVSKMVEVFREVRRVRRVLRDDGTLWLNLGDSYCGSWGNSGRRPELDGTPSEQREKNCEYFNRGGWDERRERPPSSFKLDGLKPKDLVGIPWMVAFALRADGWYLRQDIIWHKPNPMPESVTDRCTKAHEYIFLMSKSQRYFYDNDSVREPYNESSLDRYRYALQDTCDTNGKHKPGNEHLLDKPPRTKVRPPNDAGRNRRSVWSVTTQPFPGAHFATFPPKLIEPCILAGCPAKVCGKCGAPWVRLVERQDRGYDGSKYGERIVDASGGAITGGTKKSTLGSSNGKLTGTTITIGFRPSCKCGDPCIEFNSRPGTVLDPFGGSGTVGMVAENNGRNAILIELNPKYVEMAKGRTAQRGLFASAAAGGG
jgi:DNA modification methylase